MTEKQKTASRSAEVLRGVHVVSMALNIPGPVAVQRLAELGAQVTTVLPPAGDAVQTMFPQLFDELHRGQQILTLDLKCDDGLQQMDSLLEEADLLVTAHRPRAMRRLGLDFAAISTRHPRLCQVDIVGHPGEAGDLPGHDLTYQAVNGLLRAEQMPTTLVADMAAAEQAVTAALSVLRLRDQSDKGERMEVAISEAAHTVAMPLRYGLTDRRGPLGGGFPLYGVYATAQGHVALAAVEPQFQERVMQHLEIQAAPDDLPGLARALTERFTQRTAAEWEAWGHENDIPIAGLREPRAAGSH